MPLSLRRLVALLASLAAPGLVLGVLLFGLAAPAQAANVVVNDCTQAGLKAAILAAGSNGLVTFNCTIGGPTITLNQTQTLSRGVTLDGGGVITLSGGGSARILTVPDSEKATLLNLTLAHGSGFQGGALSVTGLAVITNVTFISNAASAGGGALAVFAQGRAEISLSHFVSNTAPNGGAIASAGHLTVDQSDFTGNSAPNGGAIRQGGGVASVSRSTFSGNRGQFGGAINTLSGLTLAADEFDHNSTPFSQPAIGPQGGGALYVNAGAVALVGETTFYSNTADVGGLGGQGGAVINRGTLIVVDSLFNQNHALQDGGAMFNEATLELRQSTFARNSALGEGGAISTTNTVLLFNSTLVSNTAGVSGGALSNAGGVGLEYVLLANNSAPSGGALRTHSGHFASMNGATFYSNTATSGAGGAILANGDVLAINTTFVANAATASGGAIQASGTPTPTVNLWNDTIVSNTAASAGAAVRRLDGSLVLANSLIAFNSPDNCQGGVTKQGNDIQFGSLSCGAGITNANPLLGPLQDNGGQRVGVFHVGLPTLKPLAGSPAIDAADETVCAVFTTDERGYLRAPPCDLGAVEAILKLWLPLTDK